MRDRVWTEGMEDGRKKTGSGCEVWGQYGTGAEGGSWLGGPSYLPRSPGEGQSRQTHGLPSHWPHLSLSS